MLIKVCGMREPQNIHAVEQLGVDMIGMIFWPQSKRYVSQVPTHAGIVPDKADEQLQQKVCTSAKRVGVFVDDMPQNVITRIYNFRLDYVQLHGQESATYIDNLKRTVIPDIQPDLKIIKTLSIREADDLQRWHEYEGHADMLLFDTRCPSVGGSGKKFDWDILQQYDGNIPFVLSGGIGPDDAERILAFRHPQFAGIDLNSRFETAPAMKDFEVLRTFLSELRR